MYTMTVCMGDLSQIHKYIKYHACVLYVYGFVILQPIAIGRIRYQIQDRANVCPTGTI